jgi:hypothetical protein
MNDAERRRFDELLAGIEQAGEAGETERAEMELYLEQYPHLRPLWEQRLKEARLGEGWLVRVQADRALQRRERSPWVQLERGLGLALLGTGLLLSPLLGVAAPVAAVAGLGLLVWSFARVRLQELKDDPYRRIDQ